MRTLVVSDLHLGNRGLRDVLRRPRVLERLLDALADVDRLVLLGDIAELHSRHPRRQLATAEPVLRAIGQRMGSWPGREVVLVTGNHDAPLIRAWIRAQGAALPTARPVEPNATAALARVVSWLGPARVSVSYPGVWLSERTYATHGHYLDRYLIPDSAIGLPRGRLRHAAPDHLAPVAYELGRLRIPPHETALRRAVQRPAGSVLRVAARSFRATVMPRLAPMLMNAGLASVSAAVLDTQMRHASLPAFGRVVTSLGIDADWVIFGHVHRRGPLEDDRAEPWRAGTAGPRLLNTGSWLYEPLLVDRADAPHPYWPGGAVLIEPGAEPRSIGLLDGLSHRELGA
ncbi:MAG TPA: metallophosphoesterase [Solirubrobacteraceae bacterium]